MAQSRRENGGQGPASRVCNLVIVMSLKGSIGLAGAAMIVTLSLPQHARIGLDMGRVGLAFGLGQPTHMGFGSA